MLFVDASFLVALLDERDQWHEAARRSAPRLMRQAPWRTHALAVGEVIAVVGARAGGKAARDAYESMRDTLEITMPTLDDMDAAMRAVVRHDGVLSLSDALFLLAMSSEDDPAIATFDADFDRAGVRRVPKSN